MEELLKRQKIEIDELNRVIRNYNADGPSRKHKNYLLDKAATFPEMFRVIKENDEEINTLKEPSHSDQPYFKENTFKAIQEIFEKAMLNIKERLRVLDDPTISSSSAKATPPANDGKPASAENETVPPSTGNGTEDQPIIPNSSNGNGGVGMMITVVVRECSVAACNKIPTIF